MSDETMTILNMLREGKISVAETERLLAAVNSGKPENENGDKDMFHELGDNIGDIGNSIGRAVVDVAKEKAYNTAGGMSDGITDVLDDVTSAVSDLAGLGEREEVVEEEQWTLEAAGVSRLHAETASGDIRVTADDGDAIEVVARTTVKGRNIDEARKLAGQVEVSVDQVGEEVRVCREHPRPPAGIAVQVAYEVRCPRQLHVRLYALNGSITIDGSRAGVEAATSNGDVEVRGGCGWVNARTKNGRVEAVIEELQGKGEFESMNGKLEIDVQKGHASVQAKTLNGSIDLKLPETFDGQLDAQTTNGRVTCEFPMPAADLPKKAKLEGPLGRGGPHTIKLRTLNGQISVGRSGD